MSSDVAAAEPARSRLRLALGVAVGLLLPLVAAEVYVRLNPPDDLRPYLGDAAGSGIYRPDSVLRVGYRSIGDYAPAEAPRFSEIEPLNVQPTWLIFGNSFGRGLWLYLREKLPSHRTMFFREAGDELHMRVAQFRLLLENGLRPERAFFTLIPVEIARYVRRPLGWNGVNRYGRIVYEYREPAWPLSSLLDASWLVRNAWVRSSLHYADPLFRLSTITENIPQGAVDDFERMFSALGDVSRKYRTPVTVILLPDHRQILGSASSRMQETMAALARSAGLDVLDPREDFLKHPDRPSLYLPDWHYTPPGDEVLYNALLKHLNMEPPAASSSVPVQ